MPKICCLHQLYEPDDVIQCSLTFYSMEARSNWISMWLGRGARLCCHVWDKHTTVFCVCLLRNSLALTGKHVLFMSYSYCWSFKFSLFINVLEREGYKCLLTKWYVFFFVSNNGCLCIDLTQECLFKYDTYVIIYNSNKTSVRNLKMKMTDSSVFKI